MPTVVTHRKSFKFKGLASGEVRGVKGGCPYLIPVQYQFRRLANGYFMFPSNPNIFSLVFLYLTLKLEEFVRCQGYSSVSKSVSLTDQFNKISKWGTWGKITTFEKLLLTSSLIRPSFTAP